MLVRPALCLLLVFAACTDSGSNNPPERRTDGGVDAGSTPAGPPTCEESCLATPDCRSGYRCNAHRCEPDVTAVTCMDNFECNAKQSGWASGCRRDSECPAGRACVVGTGSTGYCAQKASSATPCSGLTPDEMDFTLANGPGSARVCANVRARCAPDRTCFTGCINNGDCSGEYPQCNTATARCECNTGSCTTNSSVCQGGVCRCAVDGDCTVNADHCVAGTCSCGTVAVCPATPTHPNTVWVCE